MATKLGLYSAALLEFGDRKLASLTETTEARRVLDQVYDNVLKECLEATSWNFATETIKAVADTGVTPSFGYTEVFAKPTDWVTTTAISQDENFSQPLLHYYDDVNYWSANTTPLYIRYVSNDTGMGLELTRWPQRFTRYVELELAARVCIRLGGSGADKGRIDKERDKVKRAAMGQDAMNEPQPKFPPAGSWTRSRQGRLGRGDRGSRSALTG
jgi:hypothetical protein